MKPPKVKISFWGKHSVNPVELIRYVVHSGQLKRDRPQWLCDEIDKNGFAVLRHKRTQRKELIELGETLKRANESEIECRDFSVGDIE